MREPSTESLDLVTLMSLSKPLTPQDVVKTILDDAYQRGRQTAEVLRICFPAVEGRNTFAPARDRMVDAVTLPYLKTHSFTESLAMGVHASAFSGFEDRWKELVAEPSPSDISEEDLAALDALVTPLVKDG